MSDSISSSSIVLIVIQLLVLPGEKPISIPSVGSIINGGSVVKSTPAAIKTMYTSNKVELKSLLWSRRQKGSTSTCHNEGE